MPWSALSQMALESNIGGMRRLLLRYTAGISLCLVSMVARAQSTTAIETGAVLNRTTQLLKELSQSSLSTVPDAVLNRAQCVVLIPAGTRRLRPGYRLVPRNFRINGTLRRSSPLRGEPVQGAAPIF